MHQIHSSQQIKSSITCIRGRESEKEANSIYVKNTKTEITRERKLVWKVDVVLWSSVGNLLRKYRKIEENRQRPREMGTRAWRVGEWNRIEVYSMAVCWLMHFAWFFGFSIFSVLFLFFFFVFVFWLVFVSCGCWNFAFVSIVETMLKREWRECVFSNICYFARLKWLMMLCSKIAVEAPFSYLADSMLRLLSCLPLPFRCYYQAMCSTH